MTDNTPFFTDLMLRQVSDIRTIVRRGLEGLVKERHRGTDPVARYRELEYVYATLLSSIDVPFPNQNRNIFPKHFRQQTLSRLNDAFFGFGRFKRKNFRNLTSTEAQVVADYTLLLVGLVHRPFPQMLEAGELKRLLDIGRYCYLKANSEQTNNLFSSLSEHLEIWLTSLACLPDRLFNESMDILILGE